MPECFHKSLWLPIGKVENPTLLSQIRDLELPNEDRKVISRMISALLDELPPSHSTLLNKPSTAAEISWSPYLPSAIWNPYVPIFGIPFQQHHSTLRGFQLRLKEHQ